jgi:DNA recombination-dependent growth factor C
MKFNSFIPYKTSVTYSGASLLPSSDELLQPFCAEDPAEHQWSSCGFVANPLQAETVAVDLQGAAVLLAIQFNERILPGKVRDEYLAVRLQELTKREDRKPSKREYAMLRDEVEQELLPKAFIRRTVVPVMLFDNRMFVFTSSHKRADDCLTLMARALNNCGIDMQAAPLGACVKKDASAVLDSAVLDCGLTFESDVIAGSFELGTSAVLKGPAKQVVRMKDCIVDERAAPLLDEGYRVVSLALTQTNDDDVSVMSFSVNESLTVTGCKLSDTTLRDAETGTDAFASAWIVAKTYSRMCDLLVTCFGGLPVEQTDDEL